MTDQAFRTPDLREFLTIVFREKWKAILTFGVISAAALAFVISQTPLYEAKSVVLVKFGREYLNRPETSSINVVTSAAAVQDAVIAAESEILRSRELATEVIDRIGMERLFPNAEDADGGTGADMMEAAIQEFSSRLSTERMDESNVFAVGFRHEDPQTAALVANTIVNLFIDRRIDILYTPEAEYLERQVEGYEKRLKESEEALLGFKSQYGIASFEDERRLLLDRRAELEGAFNEAQNRVSELEEKTAALEDLLATVDEEVVLSRQTQVQNLLGREHTDSTSSVSTGKNAVHQQLRVELLQAQSDLRASRARRSALERQIQEVSAEVGTLNLRERELQALVRDREVVERNYLTSVQKLEEARIADRIDAQKLASVRVVEAASPPMYPAGPRRLHILLGGLVFAGVCGVGAALVSHYLRGTFSTPTQLERQLGLPVLAAVSVKR